MDKVKMGKYLAELRNEKNLRQQDEADIFQVTPQAISKWESGESVPDIATLEKLSEFFHVGIDEIINGEAKPPVAATSTVVVARNPSLADKGIGKPYYGAFIFNMSALVFAFILGFLPYLSIYLMESAGVTYLLTPNYYETLFKVTGYPSVFAWIAGVSFLAAMLMSIGLWLSPAHRKAYWIWNLVLSLINAAITVFSVVIFAQPTANYNGHYSSILNTGSVVIACFSVLYVILFLTLPLTRKRTYCPAKAFANSTRQ